jgi:hypothetical protein
MVKTKPLSIIVALFCLSDLIVYAADNEPILEVPKDLQCRPGRYGLLKMENRRL